MPTTSNNLRPVVSTPHHLLTSATLKLNTPTHEEGGKHTQLEAQLIFNGHPLNTFVKHAPICSKGRQNVSVYKSESKMSYKAGAYRQPSPTFHGTRYILPFQVTATVFIPIELLQKPLDREQF